MCKTKNKKAPTRARTEVTGFKVQGTNHYTIGAKCIHRESNPGLILGRDTYYHYTMCASKNSELPESNRRPFDIQTVKKPLQSNALPTELSSDSGNPRQNGALPTEFPIVFVLFSLYQIFINDFFIFHGVYNNSCALVLAFYIPSH